MRHDTDVIWPHLGHRFDDVGEHRGNAARFTCQASDLVRGHRVTLRVVAEHAPAFERDLFDREADGLARIGAHSAVGRLARPDEIAAMASFLASERASFITGTVHLIDGGASVVGPELAHLTGVSRDTYA